MKNPEQKVEFTRGNKKTASGEKYGRLSHLDTENHLTIGQFVCLQKVKCFVFCTMDLSVKTKDGSSFGSWESYLLNNHHFQ